MSEKFRRVPVSPDLLFRLTCGTCGLTVEGTAKVLADCYKARYLNQGPTCPLCGADHPVAPPFTGDRERDNAPHSPATVVFFQALQQAADALLLDKAVTVELVIPEHPDAGKH